MDRLKDLLLNFKTSLNKYGFAGIEIVVVAAVATAGAIFMGVTLKKGGEESISDGVDIMSDDTSFDGETQIANLVEQILFYRKDSISVSDPKFENQSKLTAVQIPVNGHMDILAGIFPSAATNKKLKYTVTVNPDIIQISDYGLTSSTGYPTFRITGKPNKAGYAQIKACATDGSRTCSTLNVTVGQPASGVSADKSSVILNVDKSANITVAPIPHDATTQVITWEDTNNKLRNIVYNEASNKLTIVGKEAGTTTLIIYLTDEPFGGTVYKREIEVLVRDGINGVLITIDNPLPDTEESIKANWALSRPFTVHATNTTNMKIDKFQYFASDTRYTDLTSIGDNYNWKDYFNGTPVTDTGKYIYFRACQAPEDVQDYNGESLCGRAFRFVLAVDTTIPEDSSINAYRQDANGTIPTTEDALRKLGIIKNNGKGEYITAGWDKSILFDIVNRKDNHSGFAKLEYQLGDAKNADVSNGKIDSISDETAEWGVYSGNVWQPGKWATYTNKSVLKNSAWRIRFRACDKLGNCRSLGSRSYLVDTLPPESFEVHGVTTNPSTGWTTEKTITVDNGVDKHSGVKYYNYCIKNLATDACKWEKFTTSGKPFMLDGKYIMFQAVDDAGNTYTDGVEYVLNVENTKPEIISVTGEAPAVDSWAASRTFNITASKPISNGLTVFYQIGQNNTTFGDWQNGGTSTSQKITTTGRYIKFKVCLTNVPSVCSGVTKSYRLFVDATRPSITNITGTSSSWGTSRTISLSITEAHSGINRVEYASNASFTDKKVCGDADKTKCTISSGSIKLAYFRVYDNVGNVSATSSSQNIYIDNDVPINSSISGGSTTWAKSRAITFGQSSDGSVGTDLTYKYCASSDGNDCKTYNSSRYKDNGTSRNVTINSGTAKYIYVVACDAVGHCSTPVSGNLYVDTTIPTISVTGGSTSWATSRSLTLTLRDTSAYKSSTPNAVEHTSGQSQIVQYAYRYKKYDDTWTTWYYSAALTAADSKSTTFNVTTDSKQIEIQSKDSAGNWSTSAYANTYVQTGFTISAYRSDGSDSWSYNAGSREIKLTSTCRGTTTYSWTDDAGWDSGTGTTRYWNVSNPNGYIDSATVTASCLGKSVSASVPVRINNVKYTLTFSDLNPSGSWSYYNGGGKSFSGGGGRWGGNYTWKHSYSKTAATVHIWYTYSSYTASGSGWVSGNTAYVNWGNYTLTGNYGTNSGRYLVNLGDKGTVASTFNAHGLGGYTARQNAIWPNNKNSCGGGTYSGTESQNVCLEKTYLAGNIKV